MRAPTEKHEPPQKEEGSDDQKTCKTTNPCTDSRKKTIRTISHPITRYRYFVKYKITVPDARKIFYEETNHTQTHIPVRTNTNTNTTDRNQIKPVPGENTIEKEE